MGIERAASWKERGEGGKGGKKREERKEHERKGMKGGGRGESERGGVREE